MILINKDTKKRIRKETGELKELGITFSEYTVLQDTCIDWLCQIEQELSDTIGLEACRKSSLGYLLGNALASMQQTISYGYSLATGRIPNEIKNDPELEDRFLEQRKELFLQLKKDILNKD